MIDEHVVVGGGPCGENPFVVHSSMYMCSDCAEDFEGIVPCQPRAIAHKIESCDSPPHPS